MAEPVLAVPRKLRDLADLAYLFIQQGHVQDQTFDLPGVHVVWWDLAESQQGAKVAAQREGCCAVIAEIVWRPSDLPRPAGPSAVAYRPRGVKNGSFPTQEDALRAVGEM